MSALDPVLPKPSLAHGLKVQLRVIGAIIIRELHTRFGRDNIGYLWMIAEPMLLACGISVVHLISHTELRGNLDTVPFYATGYIIFMVFRSGVNRSAQTIESNRTLLYHRQVTLFDLVFARTLLEVMATTATLFLLLLGCQVLGYGTLPQRPMLMLAALGFMGWFTHGLSMLICAASEEWPVVERFVHPSTYLALPASGMLFLLEWLPPATANLLKWFPVTQILDMSRMGQFETVESQYISYPYLIAVCSVLSLLGMFALKVIRKRVHIE